MTDIQSKEVIDKISEELKIQPAMKIPREIMEKIQLSYNINPERLIQVARTSASDSISSVIFGTHATKRTFIIGFTISISKSALNNAISGAIVGTPFGAAAQNLFDLLFEPLTAGNHKEIIMLPIPLEMARGTNVTLSISSALPSIDMASTVYFYEVDPQ